MFDKIKEKASSIANHVLHGAPPDGEVPSSLSGVPLELPDGSQLPPAEWEGKVVMFVNVASRCGLTPQYETLVKLHQEYGPKGFQIIGVPCNQFLGQEPGTSEEIAQFCSVTYGVDFPLLAKQEVNGKNRSVLYQWLIRNSGDSTDIRWNFEKFIVDRKGQVVARIAPRTVPDAPEVLQPLTAALNS